MTGRRIEVEGMHNLRDVGGYPAAGHVTRPGQLYRSDALSRVTALGAQQLQALGIGIVLDLRSGLEVAQDTRTHPIPQALRVPLPIFGGSRSSILSDGHISLEKLYWDVVTHAGWSLAAAVSIVAESGERPILVHCTAGKDRTGLVVALALEAAGVDRVAVVADYTQSALNLDGPWMERTVGELVSRGVPISPRLFEVLGGSPDHAMSNVLRRIDKEFGSVEKYLLEHGVQPIWLALLRQKLVV